MRAISSIHEWHLDYKKRAEERNASRPISKSSRKKHKTLKEKSKEVVDLPVFKSKSQDTFPDILRPLAEKLAQSDPESFFFYKLQKTYPDIGRPIAEQLAEIDPESFFLYKLQKTYPDIGRPIAGQLMQTDPESFFHYKLQKTYKDIGRMILSKRAMSEEITDPGKIESVPSSEEAERKYLEFMESMKRGEEYDLNLKQMDESFDQEVDIRNPDPENVIRYFMFNHYKRDRYKSHNKEMLNRLFEVQPSKFFDANLYSEEEFKPETERAIEAIARLEPQYFMKTLRFWAPEDLVVKYLDVAKESLKDGKSLEERRDELIGDKLLSEEEYKKTLVSPRSFSKRDLSISKRSAMLGYPKKMWQELLGLLTAAQASFKKGTNKISPGKLFRRRIKVDLSDVAQYRKNKWFRRGFKKLQEKGKFNVLTVDVRFRKKPAGHFDDAGGNLKIIIDYVYETNSPNYISDYEYQSMFKHELTHLVQSAMYESALEMGMNPGYMGLSGNYKENELQLYEGGLNSGEIDASQHMSSDIEFYPILRELIYQIRDIINQGWMSEEELEDEFFDEFSERERIPSNRERDVVKYRLNNLISQNRAIRYWKRSEPDKYRKALKLIYQSIEDLMKGNVRLGNYTNPQPLWGKRKFI